MCLPISYYVGLGIARSPMWEIEDDQNRLIAKLLHNFGNLSPNRGPPYLYKEVRQVFTGDPKIFLPLS